MIHVGKCLKNAQAQKGLSNLELAKRLKKSPQQITRWRRQQDLKIHTIQSLCKELDMDIKDFLGL